MNIGNPDEGLWAVGAPTMVADLASGMSFMAVVVKHSGLTATRYRTLSFCPITGMILYPCF